MKQYRLLKDTHCTLSGAIFEERDFDYYTRDKSKIKMAEKIFEDNIAKEIVENSPEWFEELKEDKVEEFKVKMTNEWSKGGYFVSILTKYIKDDGKEEVIRESKRFLNSTEDMKLIDKFLENYIIIKIK